MPGVGFEPTIPAFEGSNTVHALDRATTVVGIFENTASNSETFCTSAVYPLYHGSDSIVYLTTMVVVQTA
jgi:hypothetical protein